MAAPRFTPTLFDKLVGRVPTDAGQGLEAPGYSASDASPDFYVPPLDKGGPELKFGEAELRAVVRRDLGWLLNTTNLESSFDLSAFPGVRSSVLNFGVPNLAGQSVSDWSIQQRSKQIRDSIVAFEPRLNTQALTVEPRASGERENAVTFVIQGEIHGPAATANVRFLTDVEADTGTATVRD